MDGMKPQELKGASSKVIQAVLLAGILCVMTFVIVIASLLTKQGNDIAQDQIQEYLSELSYQTSDKVTQRVDTNFETLLRLRNQISLLSDGQQAAIIQSTLALSAFERLGTMNDTGRVTFQDGTHLDLSDDDMLKQLYAGNDCVSDSLISMEDGTQGVIYAVASRNDHQLALAGFIPTETMTLLLNTNTFGGIGFSHIISMNGDYILKSQNEHAVLTKGNNFFDMLKEYGSEIDDTELSLMKERIAQRETGSIQYSVDGNKHRSLTYVPLKNTNWYLLSIVPSDSYVYDIHHFTTQSITSIAFVSIALFGALSIAILYITSRKNRVISNIAYVDPVTKGYTKSRFDQKIIHKMKGEVPFTYIMLDIRKFKLINEIKGSHGGDEVLRHVHKCILNNLDEDEFVARNQADHFELVLNTIDQNEISKKLSQIAEDINAFNQHREVPYYLPIDCGIYYVETAEEELIMIRDRANSARKNNKENSQTHLCSCVYYDDLQRLQVVQEKEIDNAMELALEREEFIVYLQPKVNIHTNKVAGAEALIRWNSSTMGFLSPDKFIPYFEKTGFIVKLDQYVFEKVCKQLRAWIDQGIKPVPISVNLSRRDLYDSKYLQRYQEIQKRYQVPSELLEIEFTETLFFEDLELLKRSIQEVHDAGYQCSIDDFGSGYSSLALLQEIPVDILKLDKAFFDHVGNPRGDTVVEHVIALAKDLNMITIAEGIETLIQVERLKNMNCDMIQGYVYYKPMTIEDFHKIAKHDFELTEL